ncbi:MAG: TonB-dependent receptor [Acidobacteria bacterium]|nr:TonB-dependent receptor [Acidobacteriota bacterium]
MFNYVFRYCCKALVGLMIATLLPCAAFAQLTESTLKGVVKDTAGNVIAASPVVAKNASTGQVRSTATDDNGAFFMAALPPGNYTIYVRVPGFKTFEQADLKLNVGQVTELNIKLEVGEVSEKVEITSSESKIPVATEGRLSDTFVQNQISNLPLPQRDVFLLPKLSAGATAIPGAASSTKLSNSPIITVNGNRYRGNNYVLDGAMNTNVNNSGEPAIVPSLESLEEAQVQTGNFSSEFGRGNGAVINLRTKSGTNQFHSKLWEYHRNAALNARNFFSTQRAPLTFNQFGANFGGPIIKNQTFFFASYEGTRNVTGQALTFQVETPEFRDYVFRTAPNGIAAKLLKQFPAPTPIPGSGAQKYADQTNLTTPQGVIPALGRAAVTLKDYVRFDQYLTRLDHTFNAGKDKLTARWIAEYQRDEGGTSSSKATQGKAIRGSRGAFDGYFGNFNLGHLHIFNRFVNDARLSFQTIDATRGNLKAIVPDITITGLNAPFGDIFPNESLLRTYEVRDTAIFDHGAFSMRVGFEYRRIFKGLSIGTPSAGSFAFTSIADFAADKPFRQTLTVDPKTGQPVAFPRYFSQYETGFFWQNDWKVSARLNLSLGLRHDYFGTVSERDGLLSSVVFGAGKDFRERLANAAIARVDQLYTPQKKNFSPRLGISYDPFGDGKTAIRAGFSLAYQPHHGQSISGARALPPDAIQGVIQPSARIGTRILYNIPVPFNPEFGRGLNDKGGVQSRPGEPPIRITGFVVNPKIKTQYSESWFLNVQREVAKNWIAEIGYVGTNGINLERIDDVNRFAGDLLDGVENRINPNFGVLLFVTNGVTSSYHALTAELRHNFAKGFSVQSNYRWSKWLDTSSDTSTGQFADNSEPGKGAQDINCLRCERSRSLFDIPHRFSTALIWTPTFFKGDSLVEQLAHNWQFSTILTAQSGRPFSVWNGASFRSGGDYNADGGGGAVGGGFYDRPDAPAPGTVKTSFSKNDFLNGLFAPSLFPKPAPGRDGTLGRNTFRGPRYATVDLALARSFTVRGEKQLQLRFEAFNAFNNVNLYLPNADLSLALQADGTFSKTSPFGKSTQAFEARVLQASLRFSF